MSRKLVFRSIIVPVDGSGLAEGAIPYALAIAARAKSKVRFVLVHPGQYPPLLIEPASVYLKKLTQRYRQLLGTALSSIILNGPAAPRLVQHAHDTNADLVVMTTHGWGGLRRAWLGSVADELIRTIEMPVLVIRPREDGFFPDVVLREILLPLDGSRLAASAVEPAAALARLWDAEVSLLQIVHPVVVGSDPILPFPAASTDELTASRRDAAAGYVRNLAETLRERGVRASGVALVGDKPVADTLLELAKPERVSLVSLATHGRGGLRRIVLGSVTDKLIRGTQVPVLVTPAVRHPRPKQESPAAAGENLAHA